MKHKWNNKTFYKNKVSLQHYLNGEDMKSDPKDMNQLTQITLRTWSIFFSIRWQKIEQGTDQDLANIRLADFFLQNTSNTTNHIEPISCLTKI